MPDFLGGASAFVGLVAAAYTCARVVFDPKFRILILDDRDPFSDGRLTRSEVDEIRIRRGISRIPLAIPESRIPRPGPRDIIHIPSGRHKVSFIIQNVGQRPSGETKLVMRATDDAVKIVGFQSESFVLEAYTGFSQIDGSSGVTLTNVDEELLDLWRNIGLTGDYLSVISEFSGGTFEAAILDLHIPEECTDFAVIFRIECPNSLRFRDISYQWYRVEKGES